jgi:hypothetical protein
VVAGFWLWTHVSQGFEGKITEKRERDYWKQNLGTWKDAPLPSLDAVDLDVDLGPVHTRVQGEGLLRPRQPARQPPRASSPHGRCALEERPLDDGRHRGQAEDRTGLYVFTPTAPLAPGGRVRIGFQYDGVFPPASPRTAAPWASSSCHPAWS